MAVLSPFLIILVIATIFAGWPMFYRWAFFPKRVPDFEHRLYVYWFEEKVAYSKLASKKKIKFYDKNGIIYEDFGSNEKYTALFDISGKLEIEVQIAYRYHIHKKFEEIVLE